MTASDLIIVLVFIGLVVLLTMITMVIVGKATPSRPDMTGWTHEQRMEYYARESNDTARAIGGLIIWNTISQEHNNNDQSTG